MRLPYRFSEPLGEFPPFINNVEERLEEPLAAIGLPTPPRMASAFANLLVEGVRAFETLLESL